MSITIEKRLTTSPVAQALSIILALSASFFVSALLLISADANLIDASVAVWEGAFGSKRAIAKTLIKATPLILTGVAVVIAFRAKIWNIGAEGQLFAGAIASYGMYLLVGTSAGIFLIPLVFMAGFVGGGIYGGFAGYLRSKFAVNEVLSTVMLNYIIRFFLSFLLVGAWRDPSSFYQQTSRIDRDARLPEIFDISKFHIGFLIALLCAVGVYVLLTRTAFGLELRAIGLNAKAAKFKGINVERTAVIVMLISGGIAGLAGVTEVFGVHGRLKPDISTGFGFTGIIVAMLALLNPIAVIVVAILLGGLINGGIKMQVVTGVPSAMTDAIQAIILMFFLAAAVLTRYKINLGKSDE